MAVDDVFNLQITMRQFGSQYLNSFYFRIKTEPDVTNAQALALANDFKEAFRALLHSGLTYVSWRLRQVYGAGVVYPSVDCNPIGGRVLEAAYTGSVAGGNATAALPPQCACVTTLYTDQIGRRRRGRTFLPGLHEGMQADGIIDSTTMGNFNTAWAALVAEYVDPNTDAVFRMGVWSVREATGCEPSPTPPYGHVRVDPPSPSTAFTPITRVLTRSTIYTQRRRTVGVGR